MSTRVRNTEMKCINLMAGKVPPQLSEETICVPKNTISMHAMFRMIYYYSNSKNKKLKEKRKNWENSKVENCSFFFVYQSGLAR